MRDWRADLSARGKPPPVYQFIIEFRMKNGGPIGGFFRCVDQAEVDHVLEYLGDDYTIYVGRNP